MNKHFTSVKAFTDKFKLKYDDSSFSFLEKELFEFRAAFLKEEFEEYLESYDKNDLPTAIDSLIDLMYIVCGTFILHGVTNEQFEKLLMPVSNSIFTKNNYLDFLDSSSHFSIKAVLSDEIRHYEVFHGVDKEKALRALGNIYSYCISGMTHMGMTEECQNEFWDDVQRANMSKIRALNDEESKRGSAKYDVIKPKNWHAPRSEELVLKWSSAK
jgi:hypothetical protein